MYVVAITSIRLSQDKSLVNGRCVPRDGALPHSSRPATHWATGRVSLILGRDVHATLSIVDTLVCIQTIFVKSGSWLSSIIYRLTYRSWIYLGNVETVGSLRFLKKRRLKFGCIFFSYVRKEPRLWTVLENFLVSLKRKGCSTIWFALPLAIVIKVKKNYWFFNDVID